MALKVSYAGASPRSAVKRWYVWKRVGGGWRKERMSTCVARLTREGNHTAIAAIMAQAISKGYRV